MLLFKLLKIISIYEQAVGKILEKIIFVKIGDNIFLLIPHCYVSIYATNKFLRYQN